MHLLVDLDDCLVDTSRIKVFRGNAAGRAFITQNIGRADTRDIHPCLQEIVADYAKRGDVTVITDSPADYAAAVLRKHNFPDVPIVGSAHKPFPASIPQKSFILIGDAAKDILTAHNFSQPSIGVTWGYSSKKKLEKAQPQVLVEDPENLEQALIDIEAGRVKYAPFQLPKAQWLNGQTQVTVQVQIVPVANYIPPKKGRDYWSGDILNFKDMADLTESELQGRLSYFYNGRIKTTITYDRLMNKMVSAVEHIVKQAYGTSLLVAAPNRLPSFCYRSDPNNLLVNALNNRLENVIVPSNRIVRRILPKPKSRDGGRSAAWQFATLGYFSKSYADCGRADNIILFDDVTTSSTQIDCIATLMRACGVTLPIYAVALGKTVD
ncbi:HAD hydrolase-like protein [Candidatus Woesearchaeota archaeon]|nr:HAD hydrolase-like protein [Candidatus Woesearchaeota archaeon]